MHLDDIRAYCLSLPGVTEDQPFGDDNITFRVEGKIFLCLWLGDERLVASTDSYDEFTFNLHPTPDFIQELLSQADRIEVVSPHSLRQAFHAILSEASFRNR